MSPANCDIRAIIRFLHAQKQSPVEIQRSLCKVYEPGSIARWWFGQLTEVRPNVYDEDRIGRRPSLTPELVGSMRQEILQNRRCGIWKWCCRRSTSCSKALATYCLHERGLYLKYIMPKITRIILVRSSNSVVTTYLMPCTCLNEVHLHRSARRIGNLLANRFKGRELKLGPVRYFILLKSSVRYIPHLYIYKSVSKKFLVIFDFFKINHTNMYN